MAYINKEKTAKIRKVLKEKFPRKDGWKFSLRKNHGTLHCDILSAPINLGADIDRLQEWGYVGINQYHLYNYKHQEIFKEILNILDGNFLEEDERNFDKSDAMTDYFHVGWYVSLSLGNYEKKFFYPSIKDKFELV